MIVGNIHQGKSRTIDLRQQLDGIPDENSVVQIHNHPDDMTFSERDLMGAFANNHKIPSRCVYIAIGPTKFSVMFPTIETPRPEVADLYDHLKRNFDEKYRITELPKDEQLESQIRLISEITKNFQLGYFYGDRDKIIKRT